MVADTIWNLRVYIHITVVQGIDLRSTRRRINFSLSDKISVAYLYGLLRRFLTFPLSSDKSTSAGNKPQEITLLTHLQFISINKFNMCFNQMWIN